MMTLLNIQTCHIIQYPTGRWGFVGRVPRELAYVDAETSEPVTDEQFETAKQFGPRIAHVKGASWPTREGAMAAAEGFDIEP